jgi:hypothetical protein
VGILQLSAKNELIISMMLSFHQWIMMTFQGKEGLEEARAVGKPAHRFYEGLGMYLRGWL